MARVCLGSPSVETAAQKRGVFTDGAVVAPREGIDLMVLKKSGGVNRAVTLQIKASRVYSHPPKRESTERFQYLSWFNRFDVPEEADFILLFVLFAPDTGKTIRVGAKWYQDCTLLFTRQEMKDFMMTCLTKGGKPDRMFGFGFDDPTEVFLTRGDQQRSQKDYSGYLLDARLDLIRAALNRAS